MRLSNMLYLPCMHLPTIPIRNNNELVSPCRIFSLEVPVVVQAATVANLAAIPKAEAEMLAVTSMETVYLFIAAFFCS